MRKIELTQGYFAIVDAQDFGWLSEYDWCASRGHKTFYAVRGTPVAKYKRKTILMHRQILGEAPFAAAEVDHINGDGLDNRRANLRWCTKGQNRRNEPKRAGYSNKYKGVTLDARRNKYRAYIRDIHTQKQIALGYWANEIDAAKAYNRAAKAMHGEFASLNAV